MDAKGVRAPVQSSEASPQTNCRMGVTSCPKNVTQTPHVLSDDLCDETNGGQPEAVWVWVVGLCVSRRNETKPPTPSAMGVGCGSVCVEAQ